MISEAEIQPYSRSGKGMNECHFYSLPWPRAALESLGEQDVTLKITLSYLAQTARTCIYGHLEECNAQRLSTSSLRRRLRLTLDDRVRPPHHPPDNPVVSVQRAWSVLR